MSHGPGSGVRQLLFLLWNNQLPSLQRQRRKNSGSETGPSHTSSSLDHLLSLHHCAWCWNEPPHCFTCSVIPSAFAAFGQRECSALCYFSLFKNDKVMHLMASLIKWLSPPYFLCRTEARMENRLYTITAIYLEAQWAKNDKKIFCGSEWFLPMGQNL